MPRRARRVAVVGLQAAGAGSVPAIVAHQAALLAEDADVVLLAGTVPGGARRYRVEQVASPQLLGLRRFGHLPREWISSRSLIRRLLELHRKAPLDVAVLHSHTLAALGAKPLSRAGVKTVLVAHADIRKRPPGAYDPLLTRLYRWSNPRAYRRCDRVVALCREYAELAAGDAARPGAVRVIPCPVAGPWPAVTVERRVAADRIGPIELGFAGRLAVEKGLDTLVRAVAALNGKGVACRLRLAGEGPLRRDLEAERDRLGAARTIEFLGWKNGADLDALYPSFDLFCLPSISENQGVAAQEALLHGVPVVASRVGGLADSIRPGVDGELGEPASLDSLVTALETAISRLRNGGYRVPDPAWMEPYSPEGHRRAFGALIAELVP